MKLWPGRYLRNSGIFFAWLLIRALAQMAIVIVLARALGVAAYGMYIAVLAIPAFITPFAGLGLSHLVLRNGAKDPEHIYAYLHRSLHVWRLSAPACIATAWILAWVLLPTSSSWAAAILAIAAEITAASLVDLFGRFGQAQHRLGTYGALATGIVLVRLALFVSVVSVTNLDLSSTLVLHGLGSMAFVTFIWMRMPFKKPDPGCRHSMEISDGMPFALSMSATRVQAEFNKPILARVGSDLAGTFNASQRALDVASIPLMALQEALWPKLYSQADSTKALVRFGTFLLLVAGSLSVIVWITAPVLPSILGEDFRASIGTLRALVLLLPLQTLRALVNFKLVDAGRMKPLGRVNLAGAAVSITAVSALVPSFGITGAIAGAYLTEAAMLTMLFSVTHNLRRQK